MQDLDVIRELETICNQEFRATRVDFHDYTYGGCWHITSGKHVSDICMTGDLPFPNDFDKVIFLLKKLRYLKVLILHHPNLCDISQIKELAPLETLRIRKLNIVDIKAVQYLQKLRHFSITDCPVSDITPISKLHELEELHLYDLEV